MLDMSLEGAMFKRAFKPRVPEQPKQKEDPREMTPQRAQEIEPLFDLPSDQERARVCRIYFGNLLNGTYARSSLNARFKATQEYNGFLEDASQARVADDNGAPVEGREALPISDLKVRET